MAITRRVAGWALVCLLTGPWLEGCNKPTEPAAVPEAAPPRGAVERLTLTPMARTPSGENARVAVTLARAPEPGAVPRLTVGGRKTALQPASADGRSFAADVAFDFEAFAREQAARAEQARRGVTVPIFDRRAYLGREPIGFVPPETIRDALAVAVNTAIPIPPLAVTGGNPITVMPPNELFVIDPGVIQDPTRTYIPCAGSGNPNGAWTFATLMTAMANQPVTGIDPADLITAWLQTWNANQSINGFTVQSRTTTTNNPLNFWPTVNGKIDLTRAPFQLIAIVNRLDLRSSPGYGSGDAGELRFIFTAFNNSNAPTSCNLDPTFNVILEFGVPISGCEGVLGWAQQWHALGSLALGSTAYNSALQAITDSVVTAGAGGAKPNGSALDQLRTNENAMAPPPNRPWELREFHLESDHMLHETTVAETPDVSLNLQPVIAQYIDQNLTAILTPGPGATESATLPNDFPGRGTPFKGGSSLNGATPGQSAGEFWNAPLRPLPQYNNGRQQLSLATCNGCHGAETSTPFVQAEFTGLNTPASVSRFLSGMLDATSIASPTTFTMPDPVVPSTTRSFGDLLRRQTDMAGLLGTSCAATGMLEQLAFTPLRMAD